jgi:hypothetical protein
MPTLTQLTSGLGGAVGSDFRTAQNQLIFVEFATGRLSQLTVAPATPGFKVLGTGYNQPEDVKLSVDGVHAFVTERTGDLVKVSLASANRSAATVVATGMTAPQQLFLDEAHNTAYTVEFAPTGSLLKINLTTGVKTVITSALNNPVGVILSSDLQFAYVSEQTTGPDLGRISKIQLSTASRTTIAKGLTAPFFLTWADAAQDSLLVPQRDPADSIVNVNVITGTTEVIASGLPSLPSSVAIPFPGELLVCCNSVIEEVTFITITATDPLLWGIGLIPVTPITIVGGLATTPPGSLYQVTNSPFGGSLPIILNRLAIPATATFYQIKVDGVPQVNTWNATVGGVLTPIHAQTVGGTSGCYPVAGLPGYFPPGIGGVVDSTTLSNATHVIQIDLLNSLGAPIGIASAPLTILVNNQQCVAVLSPPTVNSPVPSTTSATADSCGLLHYGASTPKSNTVSFPLTATQPGKFATFAVTLYRGPGAITPTSTINPLSGPVPAASPIQIKLSDLLGTCTTAGVAAILYVAANITSGLSRQSQYDAEAVFALAMTT